MLGMENYYLLLFKMFMNVFINTKYPQNFNAKPLCLEQILMFGEEKSVLKKRLMDGNSSTRSTRQIKP
jgi:hypothetical protein